MTLWFGIQKLACIKKWRLIFKKKNSTFLIPIYLRRSNTIMSYCFRSLRWWIRFSLPWYLALDIMSEFFCNKMHHIRTKVVINTVCLWEKLAKAIKKGIPLFLSLEKRKSRRDATGTMQWNTTGPAHLTKTLHDLWLFSLLNNGQTVKKCFNLS